MAETDIFYEFGRGPGFSSSFYSPDSSHILHLCSDWSGRLIPKRFYINRLKQYYMN